MTTDICNNEDRDLAHEADMRALMQQQLRDNISVEEANAEYEYNQANGKARLGLEDKGIDSNDFEDNDFENLNDDHNNHYDLETYAQAYDEVAAKRILDNEDISDKTEDFAKNRAVYSPLDALSSSEALSVAIGIQKKEIKKNLTLSSKTKGPAQVSALAAQRARVSRRLLLAIRSTQCTVVCPISGIVSLIDLPVIPGATLELSHPLSELGNARGIAQQGVDYLRKLDTQVLAGIFIVLSEHYLLVKFQPFDSGAQKNAILRTAGKDALISAIIMVEDTVHSGNYRFLPSLSLVFDSNMQEYGVSVRFEAYLLLLSAAIAKPDTEVYNENAKPKKIGRPVYIRDVVKAENKISFLARQEVTNAKRTFKEDKKAGKILVSALYAEGKIRATMKIFFMSIFSDDSLLTIPEESVEKILVKIADIPEMAPITAIVKKDRKILMLDISEVEEMFIEAKETNEANKAESQGSDLEDEEESEIDNEEIDLEDAFACSNMSIEPSIPEVIKAAMPFGLSSLEAILWKKKHLPAPRKVIQNNIPSTHVYVPSHTLKVREEL